MQIETVEIAQNFMTLSYPTKWLLAAYGEKQIRHGNHPVLNWMAHNVVAVADPANNQKPDKSRSREKIDGMVALIMGLDRATRHIIEEPADEEDMVW